MGLGLVHKRDTVVLPDHHTIAYEHVGVPIEANYPATLELRAHKYPPLFTVQYGSCYHGGVRQAMLGSGSHRAVRECV